MKILIDDLTSEPLRIRKDISPGSYGGELVLIEPVGIDIKIMKSGERVKTGGRVKTAAELVCSRCLKKFPFSVETEYALEYHPARECAEEVNIRLKKDELSAVYYTEPVINLDEDVRQTIHLAIPLKPVCGENCPGLCPSCGADINMEDCGCTDSVEDPRFEKLKLLLEKEREEENGES